MSLSGERIKGVTVIVYCNWLVLCTLNTSTFMAEDFLYKCRDWNKET